MPASTAPPSTERPSRSALSLLNYRWRTDGRLGESVDLGAFGVPVIPRRMRHLAIRGIAPIARVKGRWPGVANVGESDSRWEIRVGHAVRWVVGLGGAAEADHVAGVVASSPVGSGDVQQAVEVAPPPGVGDRRLESSARRRGPRRGRRTGHGGWRAASRVGGRLLVHQPVHHPEQGAGLHVGERLGFRPSARQFGLSGLGQRPGDLRGDLGGVTDAKELPGPPFRLR